MTRDELFLLIDELRTDAEHRAAAIERARTDVSAAVLARMDEHHRIITQSENELVELLSRHVGRSDRLEPSLHVER